MCQYEVKYHAEAESDVRFHARQVTLGQQPWDFVRHRGGI